MINYARFDYSSLISLNVDEFNVYYKLAREKLSAEEDEHERLREQQSKLKANQ